MKINPEWQFALLGVVLSAGVQAETLQTVVAQLREVAQTFSTEGVVEATRQSTVSAQISGRIKEIYFDVGDTVKQGQIILRIDEREAVQALAGSQAQQRQSQASLQNAQSNYERSRQLFEQKFISQSALDKALADYKMAQAQAAASSAGAEQSALLESYTAVTAPYGGMVLARLVEKGELVTVGRPLMTGFDPSQMRVIVNIPQDKLSDIGKQPTVLIELPALKRNIHAESVVVQPAADIRTHSTVARVSLPAKEKGIYPGMFVRAHFVVGKVSKLMIPASVVVRRGEVVAVYVVDEQGKISLRQVRTAEVPGQNDVEILSGVNIGERLALDPVKAGMMATKAKQ
jgi:RND family efflux transporter MFP subunit